MLHAVQHPLSSICLEKSRECVHGQQIEDNTAVKPQSGLTTVPVAYGPSDYSQETKRSLLNVDESLLNYDLMEALICCIIGQVDTFPPTMLLHSMSQSKSLEGDEISS